MIEFGIGRNVTTKAEDKRTATADRQKSLEKEKNKERIKITEAEFYRRRYQAIAERRNKSISNRIKRREFTAEDVKTEFDRFREVDLESRKHPEYQEWGEALKETLKVWRSRRDSTWENGKKPKVVLFSPGGGMKGSEAAGSFIAFNKLGFTAKKTIDAFAGISALGAGVLYYAAGTFQTLKGAAIFYYQCATKEFLNYYRVHHVLKAPDVVGGAMRRGPQAVDQDAVRDGPDVYVGATPQDNPHMPMEWIDIKKAKPDMIAPAEASMNVPLLAAPGIKVNAGGLSVNYIDGAFSELPIEELIEKFHPDVLLVCPNTPFQPMKEFKETSKFVDVLPSAGTLGSVKKFLKSADEVRKTLDFLKKEKGVNIGMFWPPNRGIEPTTTDPDIIQLAMYDTIKDTIQQCGEELPESIEMYSPKEDKYLEIELAV